MVVVVQPVLSEVSDVNIRPAVVVVIADGHPESPSVVRYARCNGPMFSVEHWSVRSSGRNCALCAGSLTSVRRFVLLILCMGANSRWDQGVKKNQADECSYSHGATPV